MKKLPQLSERSLPVVTIDPALSKYKNQTPFPAKLALANEQLKGVRLPAKKAPR